MKWLTDILGYKVEEANDANEPYHDKVICENVHIKSPEQPSPVRHIHTWKEFVISIDPDEMSIGSISSFFTERAIHYEPPKIYYHSMGHYPRFDSVYFRECEGCTKLQFKIPGASMDTWLDTADDIFKVMLDIYEIQTRPLPIPKDMRDLIYSWDDKFRDKSKRDNKRRHHCEDGAAVQRPTGECEYWWHGISVPERWIMEKDTLSFDDFMNVKNTERRRAFMEIIGNERFIDVLEMQKLNDTVRNGILYELFERNLELESFGKIHTVRCTNPSKIPGESPNVYYLMTPPWLNDVWESVAWTFYERGDTYCPEVET